MAGRLTSAAIGASCLVLTAGMAMGQTVISARSGLVHHVEGQVTIDDKAVEVKYSQFPEVKEQQVLKTEDGRAEVLLNPGVFLRLAENSSFRMLSNRLSDTRVDILSGSMMLEHGEVAKDTHVTVLYKDKTITFEKSGLYRLDADAGAFRVYQGEAKVVSGDQTLVAKQAKEVMLSAPVLTAMKFDAKEDDEFYRWASRRAGYLALANISAAKSIRDSGWTNSSSSTMLGYTGGMAGYGMWGWNPYFGMFTYIPFGAMYNSPFGYSFYSPSLISGFYRNYAGYYGNGYYGNGYSGGGGGGSTAASRGSINYAAPSRPSVASSTGAGGMMRGSGGGGFGGTTHDGGFRGGGYSGGGSSVSSAGSSGSGGGAAVSAGGGGHSGGSAGGHGR